MAGETVYCDDYESLTGKKIPAARVITKIVKAPDVESVDVEKK